MAESEKMLNSESDPMEFALPLKIETPRQLGAFRGQSIATGREVLITREWVDDFCTVSGDHQWIHQPTDTGQRSVVPGNLLVALIPGFIQSAFIVQRYSRCITAKYRGIRFLYPVSTGEQVTMSLTVDKVSLRSDRTFVETRCDMRRGPLSVMRASVYDIYYD